MKDKSILEARIDDIHQNIKGLFPDAVSVVILVNSQGIEVTTNYRANLVDCTMRTITGKWIDKITK